MSFGLRPFGTTPFGLIDAPASQTYNESVSDTVTLTDTATSTQVFSATAADTESLTDAVADTLDMVQSAADDLTLTDDVTVDGTTAEDTHDPETWREYRKRLRQVAKLAEEQRRATVDEAADIRREVRAALAAADGLPTGEVAEELAEVRAELPPGRLTVRKIEEIEDWRPLYTALRELRIAIEAAEAEYDDEEVLLLV